MQMTSESRAKPTRGYLRFNPEIHRVLELPVSRWLRTQFGDKFFVYFHCKTRAYVVASWLYRPGTPFIVEWGLWDPGDPESMPGLITAIRMRLSPQALQDARELKHMLKAEQDSENSDWADEASMEEELIEWHLKKHKLHDQDPALRLV